MSMAFAAALLTGVAVAGLILAWGMPMMGDSSDWDGDSDGWWGSDSGSCDGGSFFGSDSSDCGSSD